MDAELGAGFDAQPSWYGMVIEEVDDEPGQDERLGPGAAGTAGAGAGAGEVRAGQVGMLVVPGGIWYPVVGMAGDEFMSCGWQVWLGMVDEFIDVHRQRLMSCQRPPTIGWRRRDQRYGELGHDHDQKLWLFTSQQRADERRVICGM